MTSPGIARYAASVDASWAFIVGGRFLAAVPKSAPMSLTDALWAFADLPQIQTEQLVGVLPSGGAEAIESFALVIFGDADPSGPPGETQLTVVVRGEACVDIFSVGGSRRFSAGGVFPWVLADFRSVIGITITGIDRPADRFDAGLIGSLPLVAGIVLGRTLSWRAALTGSWEQPVANEVETPIAPPEAVFPVPVLSGYHEGAQKHDSAVAYDPPVDLEDTVVRPKTALLRSALEDSGAEDTVLLTGRRSAARTEPREPIAVSRFRMGDDTSFPLDLPAFIGRKPRAPRIRTGPAPRLIAVASASHEVSATHLQIAQEGERVVVTDLHSSNGTTVTGPDGIRQRIRPGESIVVAEGTMIDIGDGNIVEIMPAQ